MSIYSDEPLSLQVQNNFLRCLFRTQFGSIDYDFSVLGFFIRI